MKQEDYLEKANSNKEKINEKAAKKASQFEIKGTTEWFAFYYGYIFGFQEAETDAS